MMCQKEANVNIFAKKTARRMCVNCDMMCQKEANVNIFAKFDN